MNSIYSVKRDGPLKWLDYDITLKTLSIKPTDHAGAEKLKGVLAQIKLTPAEDIETEYGMPTGGPPTLVLERAEKPLGVLFKLLAEEMIDPADYQAFSKNFPNAGAAIVPAKS